MPTGSERKRWLPPPSVRNLSIKHKLSAIIMITCVAALFLTGSIFIAWEWTSLRHRLVRDLSTYADILANNCEAAVVFGDSHDAAEVLQAAETVPSLLGVWIYTKEGTLFARYTREDSPAAQSEPDRLIDYHSFRHGFLTLAKPVLLGEDEIGSIYLVSNLHPIYARLKRSVCVIACICLAASLAAYLVSSKLQEIIAAPIGYLAGIARIVSTQKQYGIRAEQRSNDEVGQLIEAFNDMLEQIQQRDAALVQANEQLESRVQERTAELSATNNRMTREIAFRKNAERALKKRTERILNHQRALLKLAKNAANDLDSTFRNTTEEVARTLFVERVGIWLTSQNSAELVCRDLYRASAESHEIGHRLQAADYPAFFKAIENTRILAIGQAQQDPRTYEFMYDYLVPLGVTSMMDVPIRLHGKMLGLICCGHVGPPREWSLEEQDFAASIADMIALQLETGERRRVERALAKANEHLADTVRELRRSNKELQDFTYVAAHDLKAPLRAIGTLADWIMSDYGEMFDEQGREQLRLLKARVSRMNELLDSVLHYSKIGRVSAQLEKIDLNEVISETIERVDPPEHIQFAIDENMPPVVFEKDHLCQVFLQLVSNAVRYMDKPQGRIEIRCTEEGRFWKITVADNGPGIEEKYFEKIFQMFQTLTPRDECESTGIGLAIAKKIVELHGGTIGVESRLGEGTTFFFTLLKQDESVIAKRIHAHVAK